MDKRDIFLEWANTIHAHNNSNYDCYRTTVGGETEDGTVLISNNHACHAGLSYSNGWKVPNGTKIYTSKMGPYKYIFSGIVNKETPRDKQLPFIDWMLFRSPWKDCFLNKSAEEVADSCWVLDADSPSNLLTGACFATRHLTEWAPRCRAWLAMVEAGVDETEAFFFSQQLESKGDWENVYPIMFDHSKAGWHVSIDQSFDKQYFYNFVNGKPVRKDEKYSTQMDYLSIHSTWGNCGYRSPLSFKHFGGIKPVGEIKTERVLINLNIFYRPKKQPVQGAGYQYTSPEQLKNLTIRMKEIIDAA